MPQPLTDAELDAIMSAAWPLSPSQRAAFEQQVTTELQRLPSDTRGPGTLHRTIATVQRAFLKSGKIAIGHSPGNHSKYEKPSALRDKGK
jgi:hypothetical protein